MRGIPETGFTLSREGDNFKTDADYLPEVFHHILPQVSAKPDTIQVMADNLQIVEEISVNHAHMVLLGNYDAFVLITMKNAHTACVSSVFYRDPNLHPMVTEHPPGSEHNPILLEVILAAILSTRRAPDRSLWRDMKKVLEAVRTDKRNMANESNFKPTQDMTASTSTQDSSSAGGTAKRAVASVRVSHDWSRGYMLGAKHDADPHWTSKEPWEMDSPTSVDVLYHRLSAMILHAVDDMELNSSATQPSHAITKTASAPSPPRSTSSSFPSPERLRMEPVRLTLDEYLGTGRLYDAYTGEVDIGGKSFEVVFKYVNFTTFYNEVDGGSKRVTTIYDEMALLQYAAEAVPGVTPRVAGMWIGGPYKEMYLLALEDCGAGGQCDLTDDRTANEVREAYRKLHAAGMLHDDVAERHILRDSAGRVRIIDWEGGRLGSPDECANEMEGVEALVC